VVELAIEEARLPVLEPVARTCELLGFEPLHLANEGRFVVVVPPQAAARVPVSKLSAATVPPKGISMWVCPSMPPGTTYFPVASITLSALASIFAPREESPGARTAAMCSPSISTSAWVLPWGETTVPFLMRMVMTTP
jgi:hypothetical protein